MTSSSLIDQISDALKQVLPASGSGDLQKNVRGALQSVLDRAGVVTREEFEVQQAVLARTREKLEAMEKRLVALEGKPPQT